MGTLAIYFVDNYKIEVVKTLFGNEKVLVNGNTVSEKSSKEDTVHHFAIENSKYQISHRDASQAEKLNIFKILKNGAPVALVNRASQDSVHMLMLVVAVGLGCGFLIGILVYTMF